MAKAEFFEEDGRLTLSSTSPDHENRLRNDCGGCAVWSDQSELNQALVSVNPKKKAIFGHIPKGQIKGVGT